MKKCDTCGTELKPLFTGMFCPNEDNHLMDFEPTGLPSRKRSGYSITGNTFQPGTITTTAVPIKAYPQAHVYSVYPHGYIPTNIRPCLHLTIYQLPSGAPSPHGEKHACVDCGQFVVP